MGALGGIAAEAPNIAAVVREANIEAVLDELDGELVALRPVKTRIREISALLVIDQLRRHAGLAAGRPTLHMCFTGNPGTGKTTVAMRMADILHRLGYIERSHVVAVTRDDLVGQYVGHTAPKTKEVLKRAYGGVLFIDEAYYLYRPENERDYGVEAIEILLQVMENERDRLVVVLAGYKDRMDDFFRLNPGMSSRVAHHIDFPDYSADELLAIGQLMLVGRELRAVPGRRAGVSPVHRPAHASPAIRPRSQRSQRNRAGAAAPRKPGLRGGAVRDRADGRDARPDRGAGHPQEQRVQRRRAKRGGAGSGMTVTMTNHRRTARPVILGVVGDSARR